MQDNITELELLQSLEKAADDENTNKDSKNQVSLPTMTPKLMHSIISLAS